MNGHLHPQSATGFTQKRCFALVGFDQVERNLRGDGESQAWKATAGAEVDCPGGPRRNEWDELERIGDVALPDFGLVAAGDQVDDAVPSQQQGGEGVEPRACFTWNIAWIGHSAAAEGCLATVSRLRRWAAMAARAAGVMP